MKTLKEYLDAPGGRQQLEEDIEEILDSLDFEKIASVMEFLDWKWCDGKRDAEELIERGYVVNVVEDGYVMYVPKVADIIRVARRTINDVISHALEAEENGEFIGRYYVDGAGFYCELEILDDETRKRFVGEDAPDDFKDSVDISLRFVIEDYMGKFV